MTLSSAYIELFSGGKVRGEFPDTILVITNSKKCNLARIWLSVKKVGERRSPALHYTTVLLVKKVSQNFSVEMCLDEFF